MDALDFNFDLRTQELSAAPYAADAHTGYSEPANDDEPPAAAGQVGALAIIAHDLKGPLANLMLLVEAIAGEARSAACDRIADRAARAEQVIDRLDAMLSEILKRARATGDPFACRPAPLDLRATLQAVIAMNEPLALSRGVSIALTGRTQLRMTGDEQMLMQALDNLLSNAVKYTRRGGTVRCELGVSPSGGAEIRIIDEGPGLAAQDIARAFRPFQRLSAKAEPQLSSHGLGLWIARLVAERHGGFIVTANRDGGMGAVFTLTLPVGAIPQSLVKQ